MNLCACGKPALADLMRQGVAPAFFSDCYNELTRGAVVQGASGARYEVIADELDIELTNLRAENARLREMIETLEKAMK